MNASGSNAKVSGIVRWMPSLTDVAFLMPLVFLFTRMQGVRTLLSDGDTGWHVRAGEWMLHHHAIIRTDIFSFTKAGQPWYAWEWLWEVGAARLHQSGGLALVVLVSMALICTTFALLYRVINRRCGNPLIAAAVTLLAAAGSTMHWLARPHLVTFLFMVIVLAILDRVEQGDTNVLLWLPFLTIVWVNLHGGFLGGIVTVAAYAVGALVKSAIAANPEERMAGLLVFRRYSLTALACAAASLVNPYFYHLHVHVWQYFRDPNQTRGINEFQPVNFQLPVAGFFEAMLICAAGAAIWFGLRKRFGEVILLAGWAHLAFLMARNVPIFMIIAAPAVGEAAAGWVKTLEHANVAKWLRSTASTIQSAGADIAPLESMWRIHLVPVFAIGVVALGMASPQAGLKWKPVYDEKAYPAAALALVSDTSLRVFTHDEWGDYLIYRLAPSGGKVFVDGRSDFYGGGFERAYSDLLNVQPGWEQTLRQYGVNTVLLPPDAALASTLKESHGWRVVYDDGAAIVFKSRAQNVLHTSSNVGAGADASLPADKLCCPQKNPAGRASLGASLEGFGTQCAVVRVKVGILGKRDETAFSSSSKWSGGAL